MALWEDKKSWKESRGKIPWGRIQSEGIWFFHSENPLWAIDFWTRQRELQAFLLEPRFSRFRYRKCFQFPPCTRLELKFFVLGFTLRLCLCNYILTQCKGSSSIFPLHGFYQPSSSWHKGDNRPEHVWISPSGCLPWSAAVGLWQLVQLGTAQYLQTLVSPPSGRRWLVGERRLKKLLLPCARWIRSWNSSAGPFAQKSKRFCTFLWPFTL